MAKYFADRAVRTVDIESAQTGRKHTLRTDSKGFFNVDSALDRKTLKDAGFAEASLMGVADTKSGVICVECGFNGFFARCGRCGHDNGAQNVEG
jgi:hypothetical protein